MTHAVENKGCDERVHIAGELNIVQGVGKDLNTTLVADI